MDGAKRKGEDIQAREKLEEGHHGANVPHHNTHGAPNEGPDKEEQERQEVDGGENKQAREELEERNLETRGKKKAEGSVDGYKRPVLARNGDLRGDKESD